MANSLFPAWLELCSLHQQLSPLRSAPQELAQIVCHCKCAKCLHLFTRLSVSLSISICVCVCKIIILQCHDVKWPTLETLACTVAPETHPQKQKKKQSPSRVAHAISLPVASPLWRLKASYLIIIMRTKFTSVYLCIIVSHKRYKWQNSLQYADIRYPSYAMYLIVKRMNRLFLELIAISMEHIMLYQTRQ